MYIYTHTCMHVYLYIHTYIYTTNMKKFTKRKSQSKFLNNVNFLQIPQLEKLKQ